MWTFVLVILTLILTPIILIALGVSFVYMDVSLLNPANWEVGVRQLSVFWAGIVIVVCLMVASS